MRTLIFIPAVLFVMSASAAEQARCGTDAFGNTVCLDKDGVLTNAPKKSAPGISGKNNGKEGTTTESGVSPDAEESKDHLRCGIDQFGNKVCRQ